MMSLASDTPQPTEGQLLFPLHLHVGLSDTCFSRTSGGSGGTTTTVTTLEELTAAVTGTDAKIVIVSGTITGDAVVRVGSNTSLLGASGASESHDSFLHETTKLQ
jgi:pectate lyase